MKNALELESKVLEAMEEYFGRDVKRIQHAKKVLQYAKNILNKEGGDPGIVIPAAILHDIGIHECEKKYGSTDGQLQEKEGAPIAGKILQDLHVDDAAISEICGIIASHHSPGEIDTPNFKALWDADWLVNIKDEYDIKDKEKLKKVIDKVFLTRAGRSIAQKTYIG